MTENEMELGNLVFGHGSMNENQIDRDKFQEVFVACLEHMGFNNYGRFEETVISDEFDKQVREKINEYGKFENDVFSIMPYYWGECQCQSDLIHVHKETCPCSWVNFHYKPIDLRIEWYKYPFRDSYSNKPFTADEFLTMMNHCIEVFYK